MIQGNPLEGYIETSETSIPGGVRFDVPRRLQGQHVEYAFGGFNRAEHDHGDPFARRRDESGRTTYYRRAQEK